ncbi:MAG: hypothetical protein EOO75_03180 [Myxococcales bacterium]|nr:MAG: hypothetical protein EOO75_03180 [Myxococcales bacterium]
MTQPHHYRIPAATLASPCRGCGESIYFVTDPDTRRPHPVSVAPRGCHAPEREVCERDERTGVEYTVSPAREGRGVSHFANCPDADRFRK